jgi:SAM-dependent methyltransferase
LTVPWYGKAFGPSYPLLYQHRDQEEAALALDLLHDLCPLPLHGTVLDLGCGEGRHARPLARRGHTVVGLDLSPHLLSSARGSPAGVTGWVRGDMRHLPFRPRSLSAVLSLFTAFGYFGNLADNACVVAEVAEVLAPGGCWYLDYVDCQSVRSELEGGAPATRKRHLDPVTVTEVRRLVDGGTRVEKQVTMRPRAGREDEASRWGVGPEGVSYTESIALFGRRELEDLAAARGLECVARAGSYTGAAIDTGSRWILVFRQTEDEPRKT